MRKPQRLVCQSCGSTDITIDPPFYRCNYCKSQYRLPEEPIHSKEMKAWYRRHWRLLLLLTGLVVLLTAMVLYDTLLLRSKISHAGTPALETSAKQRKNLFKNRVFGTNTLKSIYDLIPTDRNSYLFAGVAPFGHILVGEISATGEILHSRKLGEGFYLSLAERKEGGVIVTYYQFGQNGETDYLDAGFKIVRKVPKGFKQIVEHEGGFIGVRDAEIARYDREGRLLWRRTVDPGRYIARSGKRRDANGNMVPFSREFTTLVLKRVARLADGRFVAIGTTRKGRLAQVFFSAEGKIERYTKIDLGRFYPFALYPTKDGGFILLANRGISWLRFDKNGKLVERKRLYRGSANDLFGYAIAKDGKGYIVSYMEKGTMILARVDEEGNAISSHSYALPGVRLHPEKIVPAFDGGFILAVDTEIHEPWLVKVDPDGRLDADLNDPTRSLTMAKKHPAPPVSASPTRGGDIMPSQTNFESKEAPSPASKRLVPTTTLLGSRIYDMVASSDGKYLYAATLVTGFKIFRLMPDGSVKLLSNLLRTTSHLIVKPHRISIAGGIPRHGTPEYYDAAYKVVVNRAETRAYVGDLEHGFYVVDISDKAHPKLLISLKGVKSVAFALSADERTLYLYDGNIHIWPVESLAEHKEAKLNSYTGSGDMVPLYNGTLLAIAPSDKWELMIYDTRLRIVTEHYRVSSTVHHLYADEENNLFIAFGARNIEQLKVSETGRLKPGIKLSVDKFIQDLVSFPKSHMLCYAGDKGAACYDTRDQNPDPAPKVIYHDAGLDRATALARRPWDDTLYIAFTTPAIGRVKIGQ